MKRIFIYAMAVLALMSVSCAKETNVVEPENNSKVLVPMTFETKVVETKTTLGDANAVLWKTGDALNVIEVNGEGNIVDQHTFTLTAGNGLATASFSGEVEDPANTFYAVYPDIKLYGKNNGDSLGSTIELATDTSTHDYDAVKDSYDPKGAIMTAIVEGGKLSFRHAVAYLKFTANSSDITSVKIQNAGGARLWGRPVITLESGAPSTVNGTGSDKTYVVVKGTFVSGGTYVVPVTIKPNSLGNVTVTATDAGGSECEITTTAIAGQTLVAGKIYDLRTPPFNFDPVIVPVAPSKLEADATDGSFTYSVTRPDGVSEVTATLTSGSWVSNVSATGGDSGTVTFDCEANTGEERTATITLSYTGAEDVVVTITQKAQGGGAESHVRVFYANGSKTAVELLDGVSVSPLEYFTTGGSGADLGGDYSISSWTIGDYTSTKGWKLNSSGYVSFTTSATLNTTVRFYFVRRKTGDTTAQIQLLPDGGDAQVFDTPYDSIGDSGVIALAKNTNYTIKQKSKEQALLLVIVNETE